MKRILSLIAILTICIGSSTAEEAQGKVVMKAFKSQMQFNNISVISPIKVIVEDRTEGNIVVRASEKMMPYISLDVKNNKLKISLDSTHYVTYPAAVVYLPNNGKLSDFEVAAAASVTVEPEIRAKKVDVECAGCGMIQFSKVIADEISLEIVGASKATLQAECAKADIEIVGASVVNIDGRATTADMEVTGASELKAGDFVCNKLEAEVVGASKANINAITAEVEAAGASKINIECLTELSASAAGASKIVYSGNCLVNIVNTSGASSIKKR